jgi:uncharacterized protein
VEEYQMKPILAKTMAILEVILVAFGAVPLLALALYRLLPQLTNWQAEVGFNVPILFYLMAVLVPLVLCFIRRKKLSAYGMIFRNVRYHLDITLTCFLPVAIVNVLNVFVNSKAWGGAIILAASQVALLLALAWLLRKKPSLGSVGMLGTGLFLMPAFIQAAVPSPGKAVVLFFNYALFVGFGEELLYRGYIQSRLNEAFGRPYRFSGVAFGWSVIITNLLFGMMHVGVQRWILGVNTDVTLAWGFWTFFSGLVFSFLREKTGSILAPALLHGLPQAIAWVAMLYLR